MSIWAPFGVDLGSVRGRSGVGWGRFGRFGGKLKVFAEIVSGKVLSGKVAAYMDSRKHRVVQRRKPDGTRRSGSSWAAGGSAGLRELGCILSHEQTQTRSIYWATFPDNTFPDIVSARTPTSPQIYQIDPKPTPNRSKPIPNRSQTDPKPTPQIGPKSAPTSTRNRPQTNPKSTQHLPQIN